jgi:ribosomal protein S27E
MDTTDGQGEASFEEILHSEIVSIRCGGCGADTIMNSAYRQYVSGPLLSCRNCRHKRVGER